MSIKNKMTKAAAGLLTAAMTLGAAAPALPVFAEEAAATAPKYVFLYWRRYELSADPDDGGLSRSNGAGSGIGYSFRPQGSYDDDVPGSRFRDNV